MVWAKVSMGEPRLAVEDIPVALEDRAMVMDYPLTVDGVTFEINAVSMEIPMLWPSSTNRWKMFHCSYSVRWWNTTRSFPTA